MAAGSIFELWNGPDSDAQFGVTLDRLRWLANDLGAGSWTWRAAMVSESFLELTGGPHLAADVGFTARNADGDWVTIWVCRSVTLELAELMVRTMNNLSGLLRRAGQSRAISSDGDTPDAG